MRQCPSTSCTTTTMTTAAMRERLLCHRPLCMLCMPWTLGCACATWELLHSIVFWRYRCKYDTMAALLIT